MYPAHSLSYLQSTLQKSAYFSEFRNSFDTNRLSHKITCRQIKWYFRRRQCPAFLCGREAQFTYQQSGQHWRTVVVRKKKKQTTSTFSNALTEVLSALTILRKPCGSHSMGRLNMFESRNIKKLLQNIIKECLSESSLINEWFNNC